MSLEESNKMSKKIPSQDSNFENPRPEEEIADDIQWDIEDLKKAIVTSAEDQWDAFLDGTGQYGNPSAELQWEAEKKRWKQQYNHEES